MQQITKLFKYSQHLEYLIQMKKGKKTLKAYLSLSNMNYP